MKKNILGYLEGWISIALNTALFILKFRVGMRAQSVAMVADSWHTLSDTFTSAIVILGFWISSRPADRQHPFGHGRAELIATIVIGTLLGLVGVSFLRESIMRLINFQAATFGKLAISVFVFSAVLKELLARFSFWAGKKIHSGSLIADAWHHRSDAIASALIVAGALLGPRSWWMDGVLGIGVSALILYSAYDIVRAATSASLGEAHTPELERTVREIIASIAPKVGDIHHMHVHTYGDHMELTLHMCVSPRMRVEDAHAIAGRVKHALKDALGVEATIHIEPFSAPPR